MTTLHEASELRSDARTSADRPAPILLSSVEIARFLNDGMLVLDGVVGEQLNVAAIREMQTITGGRELELASQTVERTLDGQAYETSLGFTSSPDLAGGPFPGPIAEFPALSAVFAEPAVSGAIQSLVGRNPQFDHYHLHVRLPRGEIVRDWHTDNLIDRRPGFDIQLFYFPHDTPREMGGPMMLPGSQYRRVQVRDAGFCQNFVGQQAVACSAGSVLIAHQDLWHTKQPNFSDRPRYMFKTRITPSEPQVRMWDTTDIDDERVVATLIAPQPWHGGEMYIEQLKRLEAWREIAGERKLRTWKFVTPPRPGPQRADRF